MRNPAPARIARTAAFSLLLICLLAGTALQAQIGPGVIIRAATDANGKTILSPNYNTVTKTFGTSTYHYASATNAGWALSGDDTSASVNNIPYKPIASYCGEPCCDLRRGPDNRFSDIVYDQQKNGVYLYHDATNSATLVRFRMGTIIPGAKGFSLLIDTDLKWGAGSDPNYVAKTTGINGNPGYELELVMETGFRIALYNIDGLGNPSDNIKTSHKIWASTDNTVGKNWTDFSQVVMAATTEHGDPDYFLDFYVPDSAFTNSGFFTNGISQKLRIIPTTVMAPKPSTAGPISDIYGCDDSSTLINQPPICISCNAPTGICTPAPTISTAVQSGATTTITGTWTKATGGSGTATIYFYKGSDTTTVIGSGSATSGVPFTINLTGTVYAVGDIIFAKAKGTGANESRWCYTSNYKNVAGCSGTVTPLYISCVANKGLNGTGYTTGYTISLYRMTSTGNTLVVSGVPTTPKANTGLTYDANGWYYSGGCSGNGNAQLDPGTYMAYATNSGCNSAVTLLCNSASNGSKSSGTSPTPTLTSGSITTATTSISGGFSATTPAVAVVRVYRDSVLLGTATLSGSPVNAWSFSLSNYTLNAGEQIRIAAQSADAGNTYYCATELRSTVAAVACSNTAPAINIDSLTGKLIPTTTITGTGTVGGTVLLYNNSNTLLATVTVDSAGYWNSGVTVASSGVSSYYATLTTARCGTAATSGSYSVSGSNTGSTYCGGGVTFSTDASSGGTYTPVYDASGNAVQVSINGVLQNQPFYSDATYIKGTFPTGVFAPTNSYMTVYVNDVAVANYTLGGSSNSWGPIYVGGMLFQGAELTISISESGTKGEYVCASQKIICACAVSNTPIAPVIGVTSKTAVQSGQKAKLVITNPQDNYFYRVYNSNGVAISDGIWYNSGLGSPTVGRVLSTDSITINSYTVTATTLADVKSLYVGGTESCVSSTQKTITFLPISLLSFRGSREGKDNVLSWATADEINAAYFQLERSSDGVVFGNVAFVQTRGSNSTYSYTDMAVPAGDSYYRLKLVDADGRFRYSNVILLRNNAISSIVLNTVRPNPFTDKISFSVYLRQAGNLQVQLVDMSGRIVASRVEKGVRGTNDFTLGGLPSLGAGLYTLRVVTDEQVYQEKVMKGQ
ncbi:T9SS type A sorting domain-containing protein [Flaviaesturariibacter terrae]